ncbi:hypothetical protein BGZ95_008696 [Linnemannia exigua]|uniref:F-box domain-containing protein n=1 Tax=Linnemannia exigua TaxID=604196 RepID=A0AAD4DMY0_9FUNG|nr:hypothetical protein BGZ95_008696 [Linnemannia exigua]
MKQQKPINIPEIRTNIGWCLDLRDVLSCALVCRDWAQTFIPLLWHTIDLSQNPRIPLIGLRKHACHIRQLKYLDLSETSEVMQMVLASPGIKHLHQLSISLCDSDPDNMYGLDLIRRNCTSLMFLKITGKSFEGSFGVIPVKHCIPPGVLVCPTASKLTVLALHNTSLTREGFVHILRLSPSLQSVDLTTSNILTGGYIDMASADVTNSLYDLDLGSDYNHLLQEEEEGVEEVFVDDTIIKWKPFRHQGVTALSATLQEIFDPDPDVRSPSLLRHFPRLRDLYLSGLNADELVESSDVRDEVKACCPDLSIVGFGASSSAAIEELVTNAFENLSEVYIERQNYTAGVFHGLLHHHSTLHTITTDTDPSFDKGPPEPVDDAFREHGRVVQLLFQILPLQMVLLHEHEMKIEWMEERPWRDTLKELAVRIEGLDTEQKIQKTLSLWANYWFWYDHAVRKSQITPPVIPSNSESPVDTSSSAGVAANQIVKAGAVVKHEQSGSVVKQEQSGISETRSGMTQPVVVLPTTKQLSFDDFFQDDRSFEARVARFLVRLPNLRDVWLGTGYWSR